MTAVLSDAQSEQHGRKAAERVLRLPMNDENQLLECARAIRSPRYRSVAMAQVAARISANSDVEFAEVFAIEAFVSGAAQGEPHRALEECALALKVLVQIRSEVVSLTLNRLLCRLEEVEPSPRILKTSVRLLRAVDAAPPRIRQRVSDQVGKLSAACTGRSIQRWLAKQQLTL